MTAPVATTGVARGRAWSLRRDLLWPMPEAWIWVGIAAAWLLLAGPALQEPTRLLDHRYAHAPLDVVTHSAVMAVAMMVPLVLPAARHVGLSSMWHRRHRAIVVFVAGYVAVWTAVGAVLTVVAGLAARAPRAAVVGAAFTLAVAYQLSPGRYTLLRACTRTVPLAPYGREADLDCLRYGLMTGRACVATCWAAMAAATVSHGVGVMAALLAITLAERRSWRPTRRTQRTSALWLGALGVAAAVAAA